VDTGTTIFEVWKKASDDRIHVSCRQWSSTHFITGEVSSLLSVQFIAGLAGCSRATSFSGLMAARVVHCLGAGICEALPVQLVNDIFFLHERGIMLGYYTCNTSSL
jgi:MFS family permease